MTAIADQVSSDDAPGAREIGFAVPERYNASHLLYDNLATRAGKVAVLCGEHASRTVRCARSPTAPATACVAWGSRAKAGC